MKPKGGKRAGAGRKKGVPNKVTGEGRAAFQALLEGRTKDLDRWLGECGDGIEIEKTLEDGTTINGRMNADPGKAVDLMLKLGEFFMPKQARIQIDLTKIPLEEIAKELARREAEEE